MKPLVPLTGSARLGAALVVLALAASFACAKKQDAANESPAAQPTQTAAAADAGAVVDLEVMAFLSEARSLHHQANIREDEGDVPGAVTVMTRLVTATRPHEGQKIPEVEEVLADAWARLAELHLKRHDLDEAGTVAH